MDGLQWKLHREGGKPRTQKVGLASGKRLQKTMEKIYDSSWVNQRTQWQCMTMFNGFLHVYQRVNNGICYKK